MAAEQHSGEEPFLMLGDEPVAGADDDLLGAAGTADSLSVDAKARDEIRSVVHDMARYWAGWTPCRRCALPVSTSGR